MSLTKAEYKKLWAVKNGARLSEKRKLYYIENRERVIKQNNEWRKSNPDKLAVQKRRYYLKYTFGISLETYEGLFQKQKGVCAICTRKPEGQSLAVDHCHKTNRIRGLLCVRCNRGIGLFGDNSEHLSQAAKYLGETA